MAAQKKNGWTLDLLKEFKNNSKYVLGKVILKAESVKSFSLQNKTYYHRLYSVIISFSNW